MFQSNGKTGLVSLLQIVIQVVTFVKIVQQRQCGPWVHLSHQSIKGCDSLGLCYSGNQEDSVRGFVLLSLVLDSRICGMKEQEDWQLGAWSLLGGRGSVEAVGMQSSEKLEPTAAQ